MENLEQIKQNSLDIESEYIASEEHPEYLDLMHIRELNLANLDLIEIVCDTI